MNYKIKAMESDFFDACVRKAEMYIKTGKELSLPQYQHPTLSEYNGKITFWNDLDEVLCFGESTRKENLKALVFWLLNGAVDPLKRYGLTN